MTVNVGFRVRSKIDRVEPSVIEECGAASVANIGDAQGRFSIMDFRIKPVNGPGVKMAGAAVTVRVRPGDNLMIHKALALAQEGDVLVVDAQGSCTNGLWGALMTRTALRKGVSGLVIDGGVRDAAEIRELGFPVFARAVIAAGGDKEGPGEVNVPISCGGVAVMPGDLVVGDEDGVAVVARVTAADVLAQLRLVLATEARKQQAISDGSQDTTWIDRALKAKGCVFE